MKCKFIIFSAPDWNESPCEAKTVKGSRYCEKHNRIIRYIDLLEVSDKKRAKKISKRSPRKR
jgi:hypothetical protein